MTDRIQELMKEHGIIPDSDVYDMAVIVASDCMRIISSQTTTETNEDFREGFSHGRKYAWNDIRKLYGVR